MHKQWKNYINFFLLLLARKCWIHADCDIQMECESSICVESKRGNVFSTLSKHYFIKEYNNNFAEGQFNDECHLDHHCRFPYAMCIQRTCKCSLSFEYTGERCEPIGKLVIDFFTFFFKFFINIFFRCYANISMSIYP